VPVPASRNLNDQRLESIIAQLLRAGVLLSAAVVTVGGALYLVFDHAARVSYRSFVFAGPQLTTVPGVVHAAFHGSREGLIQAGLLLLILTPVARVLLAVVGFLLERDWLYTLVSLAVLIILVLSLIRAV
jgi:uncharacterized membrane protein